MTITELQDALVYACIIDRDAIDDPDGYDEGSTLAQIDELHKMLPRDDTALLRLALEALEAMQSYAAAEKKGLRICDETIDDLRTRLGESK